MSLSIFCIRQSIEGNEILLPCISANADNRVSTVPCIVNNTESHPTESLGDDMKTATVEASTSSKARSASDGAVKASASSSERSASHEPSIMSSPTADFGGDINAIVADEACSSSKDQIPGVMPYTTSHPSHTDNVESIAANRTELGAHVPAQEMETDHLGGPDLPYRQEVCGPSNVVYKPYLDIDFFLFYSVGVGIMRSPTCRTIQYKF